MPGSARVVLAGEPHHVTQRGNNREPVFFREEDRQAYLDRLFAYAEGYRMQVLAYCLMTNRIHVVAVPEHESSLAKVFGRLQADYSRVVNFQQRRCGHVWQERFYSCAMDEWHTLQAIAYVEQNPLRAGLVVEAGVYEWSSARVHLCGQDPQGRLDLRLWRKWYTPERWGEVLATSVREKDWAERFREATRRGLPLGSERFVAAVEQDRKRIMRLRPRGRPRKAATQAVCVRSAGS